MFKNLIKKCKQSRGFTLMEVMVVVAILAVIAGIAIPSVIKMQKNLKFRERNDYAKSIFMAAQSNLTQMRSTGQLERLTELAEDEAQAASTYGAPSNYYYTMHPNSATEPLKDTYSLVLPANSVDSTIWEQQVVIEYNPKAGIIYSVFYFEGDDGELLSLYKRNSIDRSATEDGEKNRKDVLVGYYTVGSVDALDAQELNVRQASSTLTYTNAQEGILTVTIPILDKKANNIFSNTDNVSGAGTPNVSTDDYTRLINGLEVSLIITSENSGSSFLTTFKHADFNSRATFDPTSDFAPFAIDVHIPLDSLTTDGSFTKFTGNQNEAGTGLAIAPGDNITVTAEATYIPSASDPIIMIESSTLAGINPMYHSLTQNPTAPENTESYILAVSNGRHLQNLNVLDATIASKIDSIVFVKQTEADIVTSTQPSEDDTDESTGESQNPSESVESGVNPASETPSNPSTPSEGTEDDTAEDTTLTLNWADTVAYYAKKSVTLSSFTPINNAALANAKIIGNGVQISNLTITTPQSGNNGVSTGLFATLTGASVEGIRLMDPIVENASAALTTNSDQEEDTADEIESAAATGAMIGRADSVTLKDCSVISTDSEVHISGKQFVGGLVGYAKGNSVFNGCTVVNTVIADAGTTEGQSDNISYKLGGMVGYVDGPTSSGSTPVTFTNCNTIATVTATSANDVGGLVGNASNAIFDSCSSEAIVTGANGIISSIGGLVGSASASEFKGCKTSIENGTAKVESGENSGTSDEKLHIGGLIGEALNGTKLTSCISNSGTIVLSNADSLSDIGGMVGYANGAEFTSCESRASVNGTALTNVNTNNRIPNNNLGGLVGNSVNSSYNNTTVELNYQPTYAQDAGGFAGVMSGGSISKLMVTIKVPNEDNAAGTVENFGAIASVCSSSVSTNEKETITATITGTLDNAKNLAGAFYRVNGSTVENIHVDIQGRLNGSDKTAGFVVLNESNGYICDSSVGGNIPAEDAAGFVFQNYQTVERCIANVTTKYGNAFAMVNSGWITNCYGWTDGTLENPAGTKPANSERNNCYSSYFGSTGDSSRVVLYDDDGELSEDIIYTDALASDWARDLLNGEEYDEDESVWMRETTGYVYPQLTAFEHPFENGPTPTGGNYSYGVLYVEEYSDSEVDLGIIMTDLSGNGKTMSTLSRSASIQSATYYVYHRTPTSSPSGVDSALSYDKNTWESVGLNQLYSVYPVSGDEDNYIEIDGDKIYLNTYYAPANIDGAYRIRTDGQFNNIGSSGNYVIERDVTASGTIDSFSGTITGNGCTIETSAPLFGTLTGSVTGLTVDANIDAGDNAYGAIANTLDGGSITDCTVTGTITVDKAAAFVGDAKSGSFNNCKSTVEGVPFANFPGKDISEEATHYTTSSSFGESFTYDISANSTGLSLTPIKDQDFTTVTGNITLSNCSLNNTPISLTHYYFYKLGELQTDTSTSVKDVIVPQRSSATYEALWDLKDEWTEDSGWVATDYLFKDSNGKYQVLEIKMDVDTETVTTESSDSEGGSAESSTTIKTYTLRYRAQGSTGDGSEKTTHDLTSSVDISLYQYGIEVPSSGTYVLYDTTKSMIWDDSKSDWVENTNRSEYMIWCVSGDKWKNYKSTTELTVSVVDPKAADKALVSVKLGDRTLSAYLCSIDAWKVLTKVDEAKAVNN